MKSIAELTATQQMELLRDFSDHQLFCRESLMIRDTLGSSIPMELSPGQLVLDEAIRSQRRRNKPVRLVVLKTRRSQFTAGVCSEIFHEVPFFPGRRATIIADKYKPAGLEAFDYMVQYQLGYTPFRRHGVAITLPTLLKPARPKSPTSEGSDLQMVWGNNSSIDVMTAEGGEVGRGGGRHWLLGDELAFWRNATQTLTAILNMIPDAPETGVILQSTANGVGGEFYNLCQKAMDPSNEYGFEFVFFGWLTHTPYRMEVEEPAKLQASLDKEERLLMDMHNATLEQLAWRRWKIRTTCRGDVGLFHQEYPTTPEEAFLTSGRAVFDHSDLSRHPVYNGTSGELEVIERPPNRVMVFIPKDPTAASSLTVWKRPEPGHLYVAGADPSKGIDVSTAKRGENPDFSVCGVADRHTGEMVALYRARTRPLAFAQDIALLGRWYNWAFLCPEANDPGFIDALINSGYLLECLYNRERLPDDRRPTRIQEIGFETTGTSRELLIEAAESAVRDMSIQIHSSVVIGECQTFVIKPNGKKEHQDDHHDDCVIMLGLMELARRQAPRKASQTPSGGMRGQMVQVGAKRRRGPEYED